MKPVGILVFTQQDILDHKLKFGRGSGYRYCYWNTKRFPNRFLDDLEGEHRLYIAINKQVKGYFLVTGLYDQELRFFGEDWVPIENGEILKSSQGWRYYMHPE